MVSQHVFCLSCEKLNDKKKKIISMKLIHLNTINETIYVITNIDYEVILDRWA